MAVLRNPTGAYCGNPDALTSLARWRHVICSPVCFRTKAAHIRKPHSHRPPAIRMLLQRAFELARFCTVGLLCFAAGTALLAVLHELAGLHYLLAFGIAFVSSNLLGYLLNGRFTFAERVAPDRTGAARYLLVNALLLATSAVLMRLLVERLHVWYITATFIIAAINAPVSFLTQRVITYRIGRREELSRRPAPQPWGSLPVRNSEDS